MNGLEIPIGEESSILQSIFYSGFFAFTVSHMPIIMPEISSEFKTAEMPIYRATLLAVLTKFVFGVVGGTYILSTDSTVI